jgi:uncharacterized membrane protein
MVPLGYAVEYGLISEALAHKFRDGVAPALLARTVARWAGLCGGVLLLMLAVALLVVGIRRVQRYRHYSPLIVQ